MERRRGVYVCEIDFYVGFVAVARVVLMRANVCSGKRCVSAGLVVATQLPFLRGFWYL